MVVPGVPHHFTQRRNGRQSVFDADSDRQLFLDLLAEYSDRYLLDVWGYCLITRFRISGGAVHGNSPPRTQGLPVETRNS